MVDLGKLRRFLKSGNLQKIHRRDLPDPPKWHHDLKYHALGDLLAKAELDHMASYILMNSWTKIDRSEANSAQILDCMWVYVYKFNKHGFLNRCKARLVVRGDQERRMNLENTYAATLATRSFRTFTAIAARFDLELKQYDAVNAFVHAFLDRPVFTRMPQGHAKVGKIYRLNKALYGLRTSPLLWQK